MTIRSTTIAVGAATLVLATAAGQIPFLSDLDMLTGPAQFELQKWAFFLFIIAAITDFFDGVLARRWHVESLAGAVLNSHQRFALPAVTRSPSRTKTSAMNPGTSGRTSSGSAVHAAS